MEQVPLIPSNERKSKSILIRIAAIIQSIYALLEVGDCITVGLMALGLVSRIYPVLLFPEMETLINSLPIWLVPLFLFYTCLRITSAIGLWRNKMWGFWLTIFVSIATLIMDPFLLPFTAVEMLFNGILMIVLLIGYFGNTSISAQ